MVRWVERVGGHGVPTGAPWGSNGGTMFHTQRRPRLLKRLSETVKSSRIRKGWIGRSPRYVSR
jgi:hypothetical protein